MKSESISKALCGNLHQHLLFAMNLRNHSFTQRAGTVSQVAETELRPRTIHMMETDLPCLPAASKAEGGEDRGQEVTESWVKPLMGEEGFGHNRQEGCLVMPKLRFED